MIQSQSTSAQFTQPYFLSMAEWQAAFPELDATVNSQQWSVYEKTQSVTVLHALCRSDIGSAPRLAIVEHPWQAQYLKQACMTWFKENGNSLSLMPQVLTLGQWLDAHNHYPSQNNVHGLPPLSKREAALSLCEALKKLNVESIHSDSARYALAVQMVTLIQELDIRAQLAPTLQGAGQDAQAHLSELTWLSREAQWLSVCQMALQQTESDTQRPLQWRAILHSMAELPRLSLEGSWAVLMPAPHPGLMMQALLSSLDESNTTYIVVPDLSAAAGRVEQVTVYRCNNFEDEAVFAAQQIRALLSTGIGNVAVVAHDRVLGRRCAALLARHTIPVEDRVGWALSTTVAATVVRGLLTSWLGSDMLTLLAWLALPMVQAHQTGAVQTLTYLRQLWHKQKIVPECKALIRRVLARMAAVSVVNPDHLGDDFELSFEQQANQQAINTCLSNWQAAQAHAMKPAGLAAHAKHLIGFLQPMMGALQADSAGAKVWLQLIALAQSDNISGGQSQMLISLATFVAVLDEALELERFSVSTHSYDSPDTARVIYMPFYEAAWSGCTHLFMLGCNEAHFPAAPTVPTPLLASVRRELNLPMPVTEKAVWLHLLAQSEITVQASFTPSEAGNPSRLSPWLIGAQMQSALIKPVVNKPLETPDFLSELLIKESSIELERTVAQLNAVHLPNELSVTKLATVLQCPYHFALKTVFEIAPLGEPALWPSHIERGNLLHSALQRVQPNLRAVSTAALETAIRNVLYSLLKDKVSLSGRYAALVADCERTLATYTAAHIDRLKQGWSLEGAETEIASQFLLDGVRVHGKLDRIDVMQSNETQGESKSEVYAVLDYKTSNYATLNQKRREPLLDAQLILYAILLKLEGKSVAQAAYWRLHDGLHQIGNMGFKEDYHAKKTVLELADLSAQIDTTTQAVQVAWQEIASDGCAPAKPSVSACQYCVYTGVCRSTNLAALPAMAGDSLSAVASEFESDVGISLGE